MFNFQNSPPKEAQCHALPLLRTPASGSLRACVTSIDFTGTYTHFFKGRTTPHLDDGCRACASGLSYRWHAWLSALTAGKHQHIIFEMTAQACEPFVTYRKAHGTLRGAVFDAHRPSRRPNGRVSIQVKPADLTGVALPEPPDLIACLATIWNVPIHALEVDGLTKGVPRSRISCTADEIASLHEGNGEGT